MTPSTTSPSATGMRGSSNTDWFGQPRGLTVLFLTEMWEKFSFFGMRALQMYYMMKQLHFSQADASLVFGLYGGGVYLTPIFGGYIADRWLGRRRAVIGGGLLMALGHFAMANEALFFPALVLIALGNGLFLPNLPSQVGDLYEEHDPRRSGSYNVYYAGVNLGGMLAPLICGTLGELYGWHIGFGAAGIGMCLGLALYAANGRYLPADKPRSVIQMEAVTTPPAALSGPRGFLPLLLVALTVIVFRSAYEQSGNTLAVWADTQVDRHLFGFLVPATWVQSLNPLFVILFTPLVVMGWRRSAARGRELSAPVKMALGASGVGLSYLMLAAVAQASGGQPVNVLWVFLFFALYTLGELYILPVGLGLFARLAPVGMGATVIAAWFLASFGGNLLSGVVGRAWETLGAGGFFVAMAGLCAASGAALLALAPGVNRVGR